MNAKIVLRMQVAVYMLENENARTPRRVCVCGPRRHAVAVEFIVQLSGRTREKVQVLNAPCRECYQR